MSYITATLFLSAEDIIAYGNDELSVNGVEPPVGPTTLTWLSIGRVSIHLPADPLTRARQLVLLAQAVRAAYIDAQRLAVAQRDADDEDIANLPAYAREVQS